MEELLQEIQCEKVLRQHSRSQWVCWSQVQILSPPLFPLSKAQAKTASELSKSMDSMRGHLQAQLRCKEAENSRLCMQIKVPTGPRAGMRKVGPGQGFMDRNTKAETTTMVRGPPQQ